jgi:hypothetical protein
MWHAVDRKGRRIVLSETRWRHIRERHPELAASPEEVLDAVVHADERRAGHEAGEEWFYRRNLGPSRWIRVVVHFESGEGTVTTAFPRREIP